MKNNLLNYIKVFVSVLGLILFSCQPEDTGIFKEKVSGLVQKGPYMNGTTVTLYDLNSSLDRTGDMYTVQITNNSSGAFEFNNIDLTSGFVELTASGFYFNEVDGDYSDSPLTLSALSDISINSFVNVNIMTHLERDRVKNLLESGQDFANAKSIAQSEILSLFGFSMDVTVNSEELDISDGSESDAILLAVSIMLQGNNSTDSLKTLLDSLVSQPERPHTADSVLLSKIRQFVLDINVVKVRENLENRYYEFDAAVVIPHFESYFNNFLNFSGMKPEITNQMISNITPYSSTLYAEVNANSLTTDVFVEYGTTINYGQLFTSVQSPVSGGKNISVVAPITGLSPETIYHGRLKAVNSKGTTYGKDVTFTTSGHKPTAVTISAGDIRPDSALLRCKVNANFLPTVVCVEFGKTIDYGEIIIPVSGELIGNSDIQIDFPISGLVPEETYHYRVRAQNLLGITYGNDVSFRTWKKTTEIGPDITDIDGNIYKTVIIGTQTWMARNLAVTKLNDGTPIEYEIDDCNWFKVTYPSFCSYDNQDVNALIYGRLYNRYAINSGELCPTGWHVPTHSEWADLIGYLGGPAVSGAGGKLKETGQSHWIEHDYGATNETGFTALPGGMRDKYKSNFYSCWITSPTGPYDNPQLREVPKSKYFSLRDVAAFWSSEGSIWTISQNSEISVSGVSDSYSGISVRCIKDQ